MEHTREELGIRRPFLGAVTEQRLDLRAGEDVRADRIELVEVDDERELFDQRAVAPRDLGRGEFVIARAKRKRSRRHTSGNRSGWARARPPDGVSHALRAPSGAL